jgi:hypothetical protein
MQKSSLSLTDAEDPEEDCCHCHNHEPIPKHRNSMVTPFYIEAMNMMRIKYSMNFEFIMRRTENWQEGKIRVETFMEDVIEKLSMHNTMNLFKEKLVLI